MASNGAIHAAMLDVMREIEQGNSQPNRH
jgi:hypothetical protein